ncbi:PREDICTED: LOW QUALITY PROTEIN: RBBP8 N-terminal-like protein [Ceratotherium simum simum]|uniref:LOW QUALITY PROTEIN: RBBP8 N-terminal-like protein n=1 Tax=Ceratotherium simum simum TaxID=73337 RepID=A0ABM1CT94_CERSS|nr:PREDICTED: LOW QUALITY PROTEIN: RBBP8 N-terminal-like protein [Ceratotherium simum simum]
MESFTESLNRLRDIHENEVLGLQSKLLELNSERCRDAQRVEELCAKNHQLREQQKALKENVRVLENRLRAGLCDRCMVTQELAKKKQQEFENTLLQNLQHVFILTNELSRLQEENEALKEEVKRLQGPGPQPQCMEGTSDPPSPLRLPSLGTQKAVTKKPPGGHEEAKDDHPEKSVGYRTSPVAKISPGANLPEPRAPDMSPQRISNQLHGTIAVVRPGSRARSTDRGSTNETLPLPPTRSSTPSPSSEHSLPLDSFLRAPRPSAITYESLRRSLQADRLCLLNRHLSLHLRSPQAPAAAPSGPWPQGLKAGEAEAWEEPAGLLGLPGTPVDVRDPRLEGALHLLLAQQLRAQGRAGGARLRSLPTPGETSPSPPVDSDSEGLEVPEGKVAGAALPGGQHPRPTGPGSPRRKEATATQDYVPDKPLDLSERGRGRDAPKPTNQPGSLSPTAHTPSPKLPQGAEPPAQSGPQGLSNGTQEARAPEPEEPPTALDPPHPLSGPQPSLPSPGRTGDKARGRLKLPYHPQRPDADGHSGKQLSKAEAQQPGSDELDEPDTSDREVGPRPHVRVGPVEEGCPRLRGRVLALTTPPAPQVGLSSEVGAPLSTPGGGPRCSCSQERRQGLQQKRKRASDPEPADPWGRATKKLSGGRRTPGEPLMVAEEPRGPRDPEDGSPSPSNSSWEET